jgi:hypothetical protein
MRKNYALLKQYVLALILLTTTTIVIYSCKKGEDKSNNFSVMEMPKTGFSIAAKVICQIDDIISTAKNFKNHSSGTYCK